MRVKTLSLLAAAYLVLGGCLSAVEVLLLGSDRQTVVAGAMAVAIVFFALTAGELALLDWIRRKKPDYVVSVFIGVKSFRLLFTLIAIAVYGFLQVPEFVAFTFNVFFFYIVTMVYASALNIRKNG